MKLAFIQGTIRKPGAGLLGRERYAQIHTSQYYSPKDTRRSPLIGKIQNVAHSTRELAWTFQTVNITERKEGRKVARKEEKKEGN